LTPFKSQAGRKSFNLVAEDPCMGTAVVCSNCLLFETWAPIFSSPPPLLLETWILVPQLLGAAGCGVLQKLQRAEVDGLQSRHSHGRPGAAQVRPGRGDRSLLSFTVASRRHTFCVAQWSSLAGSAQHVLPPGVKGEGGGSFCGGIHDEGVRQCNGLPWRVRHSMSCRLG